MGIPQFLCVKQAMAEAESEIDASNAQCDALKNRGSGRVRGKDKMKRKSPKVTEKALEQRQKKQREKDEKTLAKIYEDTTADPIEREK